MESLNDIGRFSPTGQGLAQTNKKPLFRGNSSSRAFQNFNPIQKNIKNNKSYIYITKIWKCFEFLKNFEKFWFFFEKKMKKRFSIENPMKTWFFRKNIFCFFLWRWLILPERPLPEAWVILYLISKIYFVVTQKERGPHVPLMGTPVNATKVIFIGKNWGDNFMF